MTEPAVLPLLGGGLTGRTPTDRTAPTLVRRGLPDRVKAAVLARDHHVCRWCRFRSRKYQEVVVLGAGGRDPDAMATACLFCHQCFHLDRVPLMRSGEIVWLPEVEQTDLHHLAREVYMFRITRGPRAEKARRVLDHLMARRQPARERMGTNLVDEMIRAIARVRETGDTPEWLSGIRLLPLDRRVLTEGGLEFNQFPQVLAYWRSSDGPFGTTQSHPWIDRYLTEIVGERAAVPGAAHEASGAQRPDGQRILDPPDLGYAWQPADDACRAAVLRFSPIDGSLPLGDGAEIASAELSWYRGVRLVRATDPGWPVRRLAVYYLLEPGGRIHRLNGRAVPVHTVNARAPIQLSAENVLDYLRFFCFFVRSDGGAFFIVGSVDDSVLPFDLDSELRTAIAKALRPAAFTGQDDKGRMRCEATLIYTDALFASRFAVHSNGSVDMLEDEPLVADLPFRLYAPIAAHELG